MTIKAMLERTGVLAHVVLPPAVEALLDALAETGPEVTPALGTSTGTVQLVGDLSKSPIPGFDLALALPTGVVEPAPYKLLLEPNSFRFWLVLSEQGQARLALKPLQGAAGLVLTGATIETDAHGISMLQPIAGSTPVLVSRAADGAALGPALLVSGSDTQPARISFTPDTSAIDGVISLGFDPPTVMFGESGIGFHCPAVSLDDSGIASAPGAGAQGLDPPRPTIDADDGPWRGLVARQLDFYLPPSVPFFGGRAIHGYFALPRGGAPQLVIETKVKGRDAAPGEPAQPEFRARIECLDPTATGFAGLVPTLISASMDVLLDGQQTPGPGGPIAFAAGKPLRVTATLARDPVNAPGAFRLAVAVSAQQSEGLVSVSGANSLPSHVFNVAMAMATSLVASGAVGSKPNLALLAAAGAPLSALFAGDTSSFVLHGAEIESSGHGLPVGGKVTLRLDYSVAVRVTRLGVGPLAVEMTPNQPMRIRMRGVALSIDPEGTGLGMFDLDYEHAEMEIEHPGAWDVGALDKLFDVLGSRNGRGSNWIEVDLRFKLNLGPVTVSNMTLRAVIDASGRSVSIRGMAAALDVPGLVTGEGAVHIVEGGFSASLAAQIPPLKLTAEADVAVRDKMVVMQLGVDLPVPIPLANSGFGLFGIKGMFGASAMPHYSNGGGDPVLQQLGWDPRAENAFGFAGGQMTVGAEAVVGTLPDFGFSFSAKAGVVVSAPDVSVRGALNGKVMHPVVKITEPSVPQETGISFLGFIQVDGEALTYAVVGSVVAKPLLRISVPVAGRFPFKGEADNWYNYLGTDGGPGRTLGPVTAEVLPDILGIRAEAYLMMRGRGIEAWPHGRPLPRGPLTVPDGFVVAFGFALQSSFGPRPLAWAELYASFDALVGAKPPTLSGFGRAGGGLHLGPFSLGVEAQLSFFAQEDRAHLWCQVTGKIELFFFDIEGTVTITFGDEQRKPVLPPPDRHPLDLTVEGLLQSTPTLTDDSYRVLARLVEQPGEITPDMHVWPDAMISIPFATRPKVVDEAGLQFPGVIDGKPEPAPIGSQMLNYTWQLDGLSLVEVDDADPFGPGEAPDGGSELSARWQVGRVGGDDIAELLLFSTGGDLWVNRRGDRKGLPKDPLVESAGECEAPAVPERGWAIGALATQTEPGFRLPPDPISSNRLVSRVDVRMSHFGLSEFWELLDGLPALRQPYEIEPATVVDWDEARKLSDRSFAGHIEAPCLSQLAGEPPSFPYNEQSLVLEPTEALSEGELIILLAERATERVSVWQDDRPDRRWEYEPMFEEVEGLQLHRFRQAGNGPTRHIRITYPLGMRLSVVGLGGMTETALATAQQQADAKARLRHTLQAAAAEPPPLTHLGLRRHRRAILSPGKLYRLDIAMSWTGQLSMQDKSGNAVPGPPPDPQPDGTKYRRGATPQASTFRQLFFRTARRTGQRPAPGSKGYATQLLLRHDVFEPEMIERYLAGYEPGQSEMFRFADDPLRAHFTQNHVHALADAYGFKLRVAVRRTDRPGAAHDGPSFFAETWSALLQPSLLSAIDRERFQVALEAPCPQPTPGATVSSASTLDTRAWYEVYIQAMDGNVEAGRLPGVSFRTSRWRNPADMLSGLGFATAPGAPEVPTGDLAVPEVALPAAGSTGDVAFAEALKQLGLEGWPPSEEPRLSRLWVKKPQGWRLAGLLLESPEPLQRAGRLRLGRLELRMGRAIGDMGFAVHQDSGGFRALFMAAQPFKVVNHDPVITPLDGGGGRLGGRLGGGFFIPELALNLISTMGGVESLVTGTLALPLAPGFAGDP